MTVKVENGKRLKVQSDNFDGEAGVQGNEVAFYPNNTTKLRVGRMLKVSGKNRKILRVRKSDYVPKMIVVELEPE